MKIKEMPLDELELLSYLDIAYELLRTEKKQKTTQELFGEVCDLLKISNDDKMEMIGDFYMNLSMDKRFIMIDDKWDLKEFHSIKPVMDDDDDEIVEDEIETSYETEDDDFKVESDDDNDDDDMDDLGDLVVVDEEELEE